jgi:adenosine deaminase
MTKDKFYFSKTPFAELHLHLGGSINPRVLWHKITKDDKSDEITTHYKDFYSFQKFFTDKKENLDEYLKMHTFVEPLQKIDRLEYFLSKLIRGAYIFENLSYIELRHCPYSRTDKTKSEKERIGQMKKIVERIDDVIKKYCGGGEGQYPIIVKQILCMHSKKDYTAFINSAILDLAIEMSKSGVVSGIDIAGGEKTYKERSSEIMGHYKKAKLKENNLYTTAHIFETEDTPKKMLDILPYLDRIGHGIQIPLKYPTELKYLKERGICLEVCPTTYMNCGTFENHDSKEFKKIFRECEKHEVDIVIGTDNSGMHNVRLQTEFENLLIHEVIKFDQLDIYRHNAFKHAFGLSELEKQIFNNDVEIKIDLGTHELSIRI